MNLVFTHALWQFVQRDIHQIYNSSRLRCSFIHPRKPLAAFFPVLDGRIGGRWRCAQVPGEDRHTFHFR